ncbi:MAG: 50S ribosomal protein L3 [Lentisphaeria bacterium]|nr:50S ribosomal protein L3 [Lentisphaeria bacterium]
MTKGLIGRKLGMTHVYDAEGNVIAVTVIQAGPCPVLALRTRERDGYSAMQLGFGARKPKNVTKAVRGHVRAAGLEDTPPAVIQEVRLDADPTASVGDVVGAGVFAKDEYVDVSGLTKGKGFQGVVRRWRFGGGRASHGGGWHRRTGSIGMNVSPARVQKNKKMPGHMGNVMRTVQNLRVVDVRADENLILVQGAIPGATDGMVLVRNAVKR